MGRAAASQINPLLAAAGCIAAVLLAGAAPAGARIISVRGRTPAQHRLISIAPKQSRQAIGGQMTYHGGPVMHSNSTFAIYWNPAGSGSYAPDSSTFESLVNRFLADVAHDSGHHSDVYSVAQQYTDSSGARAAYASAFRGAFVDASNYPGKDAVNCDDGLVGDQCVTDQQLQAELGRLLAARAIPAAPDAVYLFFTPQNVHVCQPGAVLDPATDCSNAPSGFCGYHGFTSSNVVYAVLPDDSAFAGGGCGNPEPSPNNADVDPVLSVTSHEHMEAITDPLLSAWRDDQGNEVADKCQGEFGAPLGTAGAQPFNQLIDANAYYLQEEWSNDGSACVQGYDVAPSASFAATGGAARAATTFDARGSSDPDGPVTAYAWSFGDGASGTGAVVPHVFTRPGSYPVTLTVTDDGGKSASVTKAIAIGQPRPIAAFSWGPQDPDRRQPVTFNAGRSRALAGKLRRYSWSFGDGARASGRRVRHAFARRGDHTVRLTVVDSGGRSTTLSENVPVADPLVSISTPRTPVVRRALSFSVRVLLDPDDRVAVYRWDFGDGQAASGRSVRHRFARAGRYKIRLAIKGSDGHTLTITRSLVVRRARLRRAAASDAELLRAATGFVFRL